MDMFFDNKVEISENKNLLKIENRKKQKSKKSRQKSQKIYFSQMFFGDEDDGHIRNEKFAIFEDQA